MNNTSANKDDQPTQFHRRSIRLKGYDYSLPGGYFVTLCTFNRKCLFGKIANGEMILNPYGKIVQDEWVKSSAIRKEIELGEFIIMPNHFHAIVIIKDISSMAGTTGRSPQQLISRKLSMKVAILWVLQNIQLDH